MNYQIDSEGGLPRPLTFGEQLVGITFSPSNDSKVAKAKSICAELANLVYYDYLSNIGEDGDIKPESPLYAGIKTHAINEILNAQMNAVKLLTLKY